jgi:hypothetical protein
MDTLLVVMAVFGPGIIDAQPSNTIETRSKPIPTKQIVFFTAFFLLYNSQILFSFGSLMAEG